VSAALPTKLPDVVPNGVQFDSAKLPARLLVGLDGDIQHREGGLGQARQKVPLEQRAVVNMLGRLPRQGQCPIMSHNRGCSVGSPMPHNWIVSTERGA